jgi:NADH-quinone oxidoreductase subunit N
MPVPVEAGGMELLWPEALLCLSACMLLGLAALGLEARIWGPGLSILACIVSLASLLALPVSVGLAPFRTVQGATAFGGDFQFDAAAIFFKVLFLCAAILTFALSDRVLPRERSAGGEYYALVLFATAGMMLTASAGDFLTLFVALETTSLSLYPLVGYARWDLRSNEAALKFFLLGSFSTALYLYGVSLVYALTGTVGFFFGGFGSAQAVAGAQAPLFILGLIFLVAGLGFKIAAVPFHMWAPDTYEGAPTPIAAYLSTASKAAGFIALLRVMVMVFGRIGDRWSLLLVILAVGSMTLGNFAALTQDNVKRMLAYSSIAHAGYALVGVVAVGHGRDAATRDWGLQAVLLYLFVYTFVNLGAWALVALLGREGVAGSRVSDFAGLSRRSPLAAFAMLVFLLSLAGIPATAGFVGKWYLFGAAIRSNLTWLAVVGVVNSAVSLYFYARIVVMMYMRPPADDAVFTASFAERLAIGACLVFTLVFGLYPQPIVDLSRRSILALAPWVA